MKKQVLVIVTGLTNLPSIYGYQTKEGGQKLIKKGTSPNSIIVAQEMLMNIDIQVDVEF